MTPALRRRIAALEGLHASLDAIEEAHDLKLQQLQRTYQESTQHIFDRRAQIVDGHEEPTQEEVQASSFFESIQEAEAEDTGVPDPAHDIKGVPAFWSTVLSPSNPSLTDFEGFVISAADCRVLEYLVDVSQEVWENQAEETSGLEGLEIGGDPGFAVTFTFAANPYLENETLTIHCDGEYDVVKSDTPVWKDEQSDPTVQWVTKKVKKKGGGAATKKVVAKPAQSFFNMFEVTEEEDDFDFGAAGESMGGGPNSPSLALMQHLMRGGMAGMGEGGDEGGMAKPFRHVQHEFMMRLKEDLIPKAQMYYIGTLQDGFNDEYGEDDGEWDEGPEPVQRQIR